MGSITLPRFMPRMPSLEALIPLLYLKGISTADFSEALAAMRGDGAKGLPATTVTGLKEGWQEEHQQWSRRSLEGKEYVYLWADGIHANVRLDEERCCLLILIDIGRPSRAFPVTPPCLRVRTRRFGEKSR
jgi:putative transposase